MRQKNIRRTAIFISLAAAYIFVAGHVDNSLTDEDAIAIEMLSVERECRHITSFHEEIDCIKRIQESIRTLVPDSRCAGLGAVIEPLDFVGRGFGCCYDRARFAEKAMRHYGFQTRHVALYDMTEYGVMALFVPGIASHATSEVLTRNGWMGVDSNDSFILLERGGLVLKYEELNPDSAGLLNAAAPRDFYEKKLLVVYGLYSRHGMFHGADLPAPEFNFYELFYNI